MRGVNSSGYGLGQWTLDFLRTPTMIGVTCVAGLVVAMNGFVDLAHDHKSGETICVEAGGDWDNTFSNCDMPDNGTHPATGDNK